MTNAIKGELRHLAAEADRQGFGVRACTSGGYLLSGQAWRIHTSDAAEMWSALHRLSKTEKDRAKTDPTLTIFFEGN